MAASLSGSMVTTMGAPAGRLEVPVMSGVLSLARASALIVRLGAAAATVVLKGWVALASPLPRPVFWPVAMLLPTWTRMSPLLFGVGVTARV